MLHRVYNFNPGPAPLPLAVLERVQRELLDYQGTGISILETSHRSSVYERVHNEAIEDLRALLGIHDDYAVLFMGGGARTQFAVVPMNLLPQGAHAEYISTDRWSELALSEARKRGDAHEIWSSASTGYDRVPRPRELEMSPEAAYLHYTSNNTIYGTQYSYTPETGEVPLVCDMSSDIATRPLDVQRFGLIYAGAQKNLGPAGVTVVIVRNDLLERSPERLPDTLSYARMAAKNSLLNTPPVFAVYLVGLVARHYLEQGGLEAVEVRNREKARLIYGAIDGSQGFYRGHARPESRSLMNVTFRLPTPELEAVFLEESAREGMVGLKGHRSVGGIRVSLYNAVPVESARVLAEFMDDFRERRG